MKAYYILSQSTNPYENLALEECLLQGLAPDTCILYLWQNRHTVVIGKNQNAWGECKVEQLEQDGGFLARRLSGGGAVYHDLGNLNFTFLVPRARYDVDKQLSVLVDALARFGLPVEKSGRNDLTIDGRKFSGNAFYKQQQNAYHHGTLLVDVDMSALSRYLTVPKEKLQTKGVTSVVSRVANLTEFCPTLTIDGVKAALIEGFSHIYGPAQQLFPSQLDGQKLAQLTEKYASWEWRLGRKLTFQAEIADRFAWGGIRLGIVVDSGRVQEAAVYSDAMDCDLIGAIGTALQGCRFGADDLCNALDTIGQSTFYAGFAPAQLQLKDDIKTMIKAWTW